VAIINPKLKKLHLANHCKRKRKQRNEQIKAQSKAGQPVPGAGHCAEAAILICIKIKLYMEHVLI